MNEEKAKFEEILKKVEAAKIIMVWILLLMKISVLPS